MRAAGNPDIYPNLGKFKISYALYPHSGDWKNGVWQEGDDFNVPIYAAEPPSLALVSEHSTRPEEESFISLKGKGVYMTGIKQSENTEELIIRLVEVEGDEKTITLAFPRKIETARRLNIIELPLSGVSEAIIKENIISVKIKPHEIMTIGITLE
jgi:alpha-mannosidase